MWDRSAEQQRAPEAYLHGPHHGAILPGLKPGQSSGPVTVSLCHCGCEQVFVGCRLTPRGGGFRETGAPPGPLRSGPSSRSFPLGLALSEVSWSAPGKGWEGRPGTSAGCVGHCYTEPPSLPSPAQSCGIWAFPKASAAEASNSTVTHWPFSTLLGSEMWKCSRIFLSLVGGGMEAGGAGPTAMFPRLTAQGRCGV